MEFVTGTQTNGMPMPPGVTAITDLKNQKRANKTLSKAVSLHLEGKLEGAARLLSKAVEDGERAIGIFVHAHLGPDEVGAGRMRRDLQALVRKTRSERPRASGE